MLVYTLTRQLVSICRFYANMFGVKNHPSSMPKLYANCLFQLAYLGTLLCADFGRQHLLAYNGSILWCRYWYANTVRVRDRHSSVPFSTPTQFAYGCQQMCAIQYANTVRVRMPYWGVPFCTPTQFAYGCLQMCAIQYANTVRVWMPIEVCHSVRQHSSRMSVSQQCAILYAKTAKDMKSKPKTLQEGYSFFLEKVNWRFWAELSQKFLPFWV